jgi:primosomal protein N'
MRVYDRLVELNESLLEFRLTSRCGKCWGTGLCPTCYGAMTLHDMEGAFVRCPDCWDPRQRRNRGQCPRCQGLGEDLEVL